MLLSKATYSAFRLYIFWQYMCSVGIEPTTFALLTQCSTTEPQEHMHCYADDTQIYLPLKQSPNGLEALCPPCLMWKPGCFKMWQTDKYSSQQPTIHCIGQNYTFSVMPKIIRILRSCSMKINIKLNFWSVICIKNLIWTTLKMIFSIFRFFCILRFHWRCN